MGALLPALFLALLAARTPAAAGSPAAPALPPGPAPGLVARPASPPEPLALPRRPLRPSTVNYWAEWHRATTAVMAGPRASPLYRDTATHLDTWWRLAAHDVERPWIDPADEDRARDLALVGVVAGLQQVIRRTLERDAALGVVHRVASTASGANLELRGGGSGPRLRYNATDSTEAVRLQSAHLDDDRPLPERRPTARAGVGLRLHDRDESAEVIDPTLAATAFVDLRRVGLDGLRLEASHTDPAAWRQARETRWRAAARQGVLPRLSVLGRVSGEERRAWLPTTAAGALSYRLPAQAPWFLRTELTRRLPHPEDGELPAVEGEWRAMLRLQASLRWRLPQEADAWPLGQEVGAPGRAMPDPTRRPD